MRAADAERPGLTDSEFRLFGEMLRGHCGLNFTEDTRFLLEKRLLRRMEQLDLPSFSAYHYMLRHEHARD